MTTVIPQVLPWTIRKTLYLMSTFKNSMILRISTPIVLRFILMVQKMTGLDADLL